MGDRRYVARFCSWRRGPSWTVELTGVRGGDRTVAEGMSERMARLVARLLNEREVSK